ncbi:MAG TPA: hypothetical protein ENL03_04645, partial [Phycisphaerae bacterium]|nr:hypothetical protein [Phycisphaerae bacterium]
MSEKRYVRGITGVSLVAILFALVLAGVLLQWDVITLNTHSFSAEHTVPMPLMVVLVLLVLVCGAVWALAKVRLLSKAEMLCVVFAMMIAIPLMTQGFWHRFIGITATIPQDPVMFQYQGRFPDKLWPHGPNILENAFEKDNTTGRTINGNVTWEEIEYQPGKKAVMPVLVNKVGDENARIRIKIPMTRDGEDIFSIKEPFLFSLCVRPGKSPKFEMNAKSKYYCRIFPDDSQTSVPIFHSSASGKYTFIQESAFARIG